MPGHHLIRIGAMGHVGRFAAVDATRYPRRSRVIVRTARGLEVGDVLAPPDEADQYATADGEILRGMTTEDELLAARLEARRSEAFAACIERLDQHGCDVALLDVEQMFDGQGLYFYFLGDVGPNVEQITAELAATYDATAQLAQFAETLTAGCGPDCGTEHADGGGCDTCHGCAVAAACR